MISIPVISMPLSTTMLAVLAMVTTGNFSPEKLLQLLGETGSVAAGSNGTSEREISAEEDRWAAFSKVVLGDTEDGAAKQRVHVSRESRNSVDPAETENHGYAA